MINKSKYFFCEYQCSSRFKDCYKYCDRYGNRKESSKTEDKTIKNNHIANINKMVIE